MRLRRGFPILSVALGVALVAACRKSESTQAAAPATPTPLGVAQHPPFGFIDTPKEGDTVASGSWSFGWALDDSGVARVDVFLDNGPAVAAGMGKPFPGVKEAYPTYPDSDKAGFGFVIPSAPAGSHLLTVTITAKDGGKTDLRRHIQIK
jgi:Bacterial Ig domain